MALLLVGLKIWVTQGVLSEIGSQEGRRGREGNYTHTERVSEFAEI